MAGKNVRRGKTAHYGGKYDEREKNRRNFQLCQCKRRKRFRKGWVGGTTHTIGSRRIKDKRVLSGSYRLKQVFYEEEDCILDES